MYIHICRFYPQKTQNKETLEDFLPFSSENHSPSIMNNYHHNHHQRHLCTAAKTSSTSPLLEKKLSKKFVLQFDEKTYKKVLWDKMQRKQKNNKKEFLCSVSNTPDQTYITEKWTTYRASKLARLKNRNKQPLYNDDFFSMKKIQQKWKISLLL